MSLNKTLEILELIQLHEMISTQSANSAYRVRYRELVSRYSKEDIADLSMSNTNKIFQQTGYMKKYCCTNKDCRFEGYTEDLSDTCDICYSPVLRIV